MNDVVKWGVIGLGALYVYTNFIEKPAAATTTTSGTPGTPTAPMVPVSSPTLPKLPVGGASKTPVTPPAAPTPPATPPPATVGIPPSFAGETLASQLAALALAQDGTDQLNSDQWTYYLNEIFGVPGGIVGDLWTPDPSQPDNGRSKIMTVNQYMANYAALGLPVPAGRSLRGLSGGTWGGRRTGMRGAF